MTPRLRLLRTLSRLRPSSSMHANIPCLARSVSTHPTRYHGEKVRIVEVGARDGLQNEAMPIPTSTKLSLLSRLAGAGLTHIEAGAFVSPKWVPQMATSPEILAALTAEKRGEGKGTRWSWLVPNETGLRTFLSKESSTDAHEIAVFASASEGFSQKNLNCDIATSLSRIRRVVATATEHGYRVRGYVSMVIACPYSGTTPPEAVARVARELLSMGCYEVSLGDTNGLGTPRSVGALLEHLTGPSGGLDVSRLAAHWHDTYGMAVVNAAAALEYGVRVFDASVAGLGGCPYAKGATGNVATEDLVWFLEGVGCDTGVRLEELCKVGSWVSKELKRANGSHVGAAWERNPQGLKALLV